MLRATVWKRAVAFTRYRRTNPYGIKTLKTCAEMLLTEFLMHVVNIINAN